MLYLIISIISLLLIVLSKFLFKVNIKIAKNIAEDKALNNATSQLPENIEVCKSILKIINNPEVKIENSVNKNSGTSLYIAISDKILIADLKENFTRFQTIAHECAHSIQNRFLQITHFVFANLFKIIFWISLILVIIEKNNYILQSLITFSVIGTVYSTLKYVLEKDAIINSKPLAIQYLKESKKVDNKTIENIENKYTKINDMGLNYIKFTCILDVFLRIFVYCILVYLKELFV